MFAIEMSAIGLVGVEWMGDFGVVILLHKDVAIMGHFLMAVPVRIPNGYPSVGGVL